MSLDEFLTEYDASLVLALAAHLRLVVVSTAIAVVTGLPLAVLFLKGHGYRRVIMPTLNGIQTIPSIALFALMIPLLTIIQHSIGQVPATIALVLYALLPIVRSSYDALRTVPAEIVEAAKGLGMTESQIFRNILLPLGMPGIMSGIRLATVGGIGVASVAAYVGAGGLGEFIQRGIATGWSTMIVAGVVAIITVTLVTEVLMSVVERISTPRGVRLLRRARR